MAKKIIAMILCAAFVICMAGCSSSTLNNELEQTRESLDSWLLDGVLPAYNTFTEKYKTQIDEQCPETFEKMNQPFAKTNMSAFGVVFEKASEQTVANKFTYEATDYNQVFDIYFDAANKKVAMEINDSTDNSIELTEIRSVDKDTVAMQHYVTTDDGRYNLTKIYFKGTNGYMSYSYDLSVRPTRLYAATEVTEEFAASGDEVLKMQNGKLEFSSTRTLVESSAEFIEWFGTFKTGVEKYQMDNVEKANELGKGAEFNEYLLAFERQDVVTPICNALERGKLENGMYILSENGENIVVSYNGSTANLSLRYTKGDVNFAFELREIGKRQYSYQYYNRENTGLYSAYKVVLRLEGDSRIGASKNLTTKPDLVYSKGDDAVGFTWVESGTQNYFSMVSGELTFVDNQAVAEVE